MNLYPHEDRVIVRPAEAEKTTAAGIVIPDSAQEKPAEGKVLAAGWLHNEPGRRLNYLVGSTVVYSKFAGTEIEEDGEKLLILSVRDILATKKENSDDK